MRTLPHQDDYNRSWPGTPRPDTPVARLMREVVEIVRQQAPFASIDIHNNTGHNPHYACVNSLAETHLHLARLFSRTVVYFERAGRRAIGGARDDLPGGDGRMRARRRGAGVAHAAEFVASASPCSAFPIIPCRTGDLDLMRTFAIIKVPPDASFSYDGTDADFRLRADLDQLNFSELDPGTVFGIWAAAARSVSTSCPATSSRPARPLFRVCSRRDPAVATRHPGHAHARSACRPSRLPGLSDASDRARRPADLD